MQNSKFKIATIKWRSNEFREYKDFLHSPQFHKFST